MSLAKSLPWTKVPLIINGPMAGSATASLAIAVTRAGGLGQIGGTSDLQTLDNELSIATSALARHNDLLPVGVGFLMFQHEKQQAQAIDLVGKHRPAVTWLFGARDLADYASWTSCLRAALPKKAQVWIQVGSVAAAVRVARDAQPDVLCVQGSDAGGHGLEAGAGIISLLPEVVDTLTDLGLSEKVSLVAAGGIAEARAGAAAFALGAQGVVLGTRFLAAHETKIHAAWRKAVLATSDGGQTTVRAKVFDELKGPNQWPSEYDGRSLRTGSYVDHQNGIGVDELRKRLAEAAKTEDGGYGVGVEGRAATWSGTGVGSVRKEQPAAEIVEEMRSGIVKALEAARTSLSA